MTDPIKVNVTKKKLSKDYAGLKGYQYSTELTADKSTREFEYKNSENGYYNVNDNGKETTQKIPDFQTQDVVLKPDSKNKISIHWGYYRSTDNAHPKCSLTLTTQGKPKSYSGDGLSSRVYQVSEAIIDAMNRALSDKSLSDDEQNNFKALLKKVSADLKDEKLSVSETNDIVNDAKKIAKGDKKTAYIF